MTIKLLWLRSRDYTDLRIFAGPDTDRRPYIGTFRMTNAVAEVFRGVLVAGAACDPDVNLAEVGWTDVVAT